MEKQDKVRFDLDGLVRYLARRIWIILLVSVVFALGGYIVGKITIVPQYTASTRIYVFRDNDEMNYAGLQVATQLRRDCAILITGDNVTKKVVENLNLSMSPAALGKRIHVTSEDNTRILQLDYTDTNPERAALIINEVREVAMDQINDIMKVDVVSTVYEAEVPRSSSSMSATQYGMLAALIGAVLSLIALIAVFVRDDAIRTEEDAERYLGLSVLAVVPVSEELGTAKRAAGQKGIRSLLYGGKK